MEQLGTCKYSPALHLLNHHMYGNSCRDWKPSVAGRTDDSLTIYHAAMLYTELSEREGSSSDREAAGNLMKLAEKLEHAPKIPPNTYCYEGVTYVLSTTGSASAPTPAEKEIRDTLRQAERDALIELWDAATIMCESLPLYSASSSAFQRKQRLDAALERVTQILGACV